MKKLLNKIRRKPETDQSARITTETIAEHRERILAGGRRFKYPVQYARHKLVFNAIIIGVATIALLVVLIWWQLYPAQNTSDFMYRVTRVVPLSVASVDGQSVRYSDYLMKYRSSIHYLVEKEQLNLNTEDGRRQSDFVKSQAMSDALADAYAGKLAKERNITVSDAELETFLRLQRNSGDGLVSESTYNAVINDYYGWSPDEYREAMRSKLLRQKVAFAVDEQASDMSERVAGIIEDGTTNMKKAADEANKSAAVNVVYGTFGWVPKSNQDGGLAAAAAGLKKGQISGAITSSSGDGYYFVKLIDINETEVNYQYIRVPLTQLANTIAQIEKDESVTKVYIDIPEVTAPEQE
jgi:hypothetical protein